MITRCPTTVAVRKLIPASCTLVDPPPPPGCHVEVAGTVKYRTVKYLKTFALTLNKVGTQITELPHHEHYIHDHIPLNTVHIVPRAQIAQLGNLKWKPSEGARREQPLPGVPGLGMFGCILATSKTLYL